MTTWTINGKTPDQSFVFRSGLRMQITPEGDCREATFQAKGAGLGIRPLDAVQITCNGTPVFYGEVRVGGNVYDVDGHQYTLRSLALRLKEVVIPSGWSAPQQPAHLTVRSLLEAVLDQLGGAISIGTISDLGFNCRAIKNANQQNPYALLEQIASDGAGRGVKVRFGVNPNRQFFWVKAREDVAALTNNMLTGATRFTAPVAETPCTAVLWYVTKRPDGSWVTHLSEAPEVAVYGRRVKALSLAASVNPWQVVTGSYSWRESSDYETWTVPPNPPGVFADVLTDGLAGPTDPAQAAQVSGKFGALVFTGDQPIQRVVYAGIVWSITANGDSSAVASRLTWSSTREPDPTQRIVEYSAGWASGVVYTPGNLPAWVVAVSNSAALGDGAVTSFNTAEFRAERLDTALLDRLARFHYNIPASAPADIELREFRPPSACAGYVTLNGWQSPVEAWEYRLSADRGLTVGVLAGQADDPNKLAQAELIKARDGRAVITALASRS